MAGLMQRAKDFLAERAARSGMPRPIPGAPAERPLTAAPVPTPVLIVGHAGWINAVRLLGQHPSAAHWPAPIRYGSLLRIAAGPGAGA